MNKNDRIKEHYVVVTKTIKELKDMPDVDYQGVNIYNYDNDISKLTTEEKLKQAQYTWNVKRIGRVRLYDENIKDIISGVIENVALSKYRGDFYEKALEEVYNTDVYVCVDLNYKQRDDGEIEGDIYADSIYTKYTLEDKYSHEKAVLTYDKVNELEDKLNKLKIGVGYGDSRTEVKLQEIKINFDSYSQSNLKDIPKKLARIIKTNLTYCLKDGKNIVPDEYLDKGKVGIEEWQSTKRSANKNNSMEKRLVRDCIRQKKQLLDKYLNGAMLQISMNQDWTIPALAVNGRFNQGCMRKLVTQLLKGKSEQQLFEIEDEAMLEMAKNYWKKKLQEAIKRIDSLTANQQ